MENASITKGYSACTVPLGFASPPNRSAPNQEWAIDFASDIAASGQRLRIFSVVDTFTRECMALETDTSMPRRRCRLARWAQEAYRIAKRRAAFRGP